MKKKKIKKMKKKMKRKMKMKKKMKKKKKMKMKMKKKEEDEEKYNDAITKLENDSLKAKLIQLKIFNDEKKKIEEKQELKEKNILKNNYEQKYKEIYEKIEDIILNKNTTYEISEEEKQKYSITDNNEEEKEITDYWKTVLINANFFSMNEKDKTILNNIINVKYNPSTDSKDFTVEFIFKENEYFEPNILTKTYKMDKKGSLYAMDASKITWKSESLNPTIKIKTKTIKKGKKVKKKILKKK